MSKGLKAARQTDMPSETRLEKGRGTRCCPHARFFVGFTSVLQRGGEQQAKSTCQAKPVVKIMQNVRFRKVLQNGRQKHNFVIPRSRQRGGGGTVSSEAHVLQTNCFATFFRSPATAIAAMQRRKNIQVIESRLQKLVLECFSGHSPSQGALDPLFPPRDIRFTAPRRGSKKSNNWFGK